MKTSEVLERALQRFGENGEHWLRGIATDGAGNYCSIGAIGCSAGDGNEAEAARRMLRKAVGVDFVGTQWNDKAAGFSEIRTGFLKAIELAKQQEQANDN